MASSTGRRRKSESGSVPEGRRPVARDDDGDPLGPEAVARALNRARSGKAEAEGVAAAATSRAAAAEARLAVETKARRSAEARLHDVSARSLVLQERAVAAAEAEAQVEAAARESKELQAAASDAAMRANALEAQNCDLRAALDAALTEGRVGSQSRSLLERRVHALNAQARAADEKARAAEQRAQRAEARAAELEKAVASHEGVAVVDACNAMGAEAGHGASGSPKSRRRGDADDAPMMRIGVLKQVPRAQQLVLRVRVAEGDAQRATARADAAEAAALKSEAAREAVQDLLDAYESFGGADRLSQRAIKAEAELSAAADRLAEAEAELQATRNELAAARRDKLAAEAHLLPLREDVTALNEALAQSKDVCGAALKRAAAAEEKALFARARRMGELGAEPGVHPTPAASGRFTSGVAQSPAAPDVPLASPTVLFPTSAQTHVSQPSPSIAASSLVSPAPAMRLRFPSASPATGSRLSASALHWQAVKRHCSELRLKLAATS